MIARRLLSGFVVVAGALVLGGCISANMVADLMVEAPNQGHPHAGKFGNLASAFYTEQLRVSVGPPPATIAVAVIAPRNYGFQASDEWARGHKALVLKWRVSANMTSKRETANTNKLRSEHQDAASEKQAMEYLQNMLNEAVPKLPVCRPTGTVILLPGWGESKDTLIGYALDFANHGYRVVLVDLRGQGQSSGDFVTYGLIEHRDIGHVISALYAHELVVGKLALVGFSEGATIALDTAAVDPRVDAVVAVAPFVNLETAIRGVGNVFMPDLSKAVSKKKLARALDLADQKVGMNLADADPTSRVGTIGVPAFYVAGGKDVIAPALGVKALADKTPDATYLEIPDYPHMALYFGVATVGPPTLDALATALGPPVDPACLAEPPPPDLHYFFPFSFTLHKR